MPTVALAVVSKPTQAPESWPDALALPGVTVVPFQVPCVLNGRSNFAVKYTVDLFGMSQNLPSVISPVTWSSPTMDTSAALVKACESPTLNSTLAEVVAG